MILGPIDQFGCLSACSSVAARIASRVQVRNGPPDAVMTMRLTSSRGPAVSAWKIALCSESTGSTVAPDAAAVRMNTAPAQTRHSLLASATVAPRLTAASVGFRSDRAADRGHHPVGRTLRRLDHGGLAARSLDAGAGKRVLEFAIGRRIGDDRKARVQLARDLRELRRVRLAVTASTRYRPLPRLSRSTVLMPTEPVAPSTVTVRTAGAQPVVRRDVCGLTTCITHHTMRPRAGAIESAVRDADQRRRARGRARNRRAGPSARRGRE